MSPPHLLSPNLASGFTLIEVLVVLTISAILLAVGVPMFNSTIGSVRASDAANSLLAAIELTRSEAIRRGVNASVCRVQDPTVAMPVCAIGAVGSFVTGDWAAGWAVFAETDVTGADGVIDPGDQVVLIQDRFPAGGASRAEMVVGGVAPIAAMTFRPDGMRVGGGVIGFNVTYPQAAAGASMSTRTGTVSAMGQVTVRRP